MDEHAGTTPRSSDLLSKGDEVEEWIDLRFFRPLGLKVARVCEPTSVTPNQVTLLCLLSGLVAGHLFVYESFWLNLAGLALFLVSDVFDSADGQLARLRKSSSRFGRILDGVSDNLRFVGLYFHLVVRFHNNGWSWSAAYAILLTAGFCHSLQSMAADFVRHAYLRLGKGSGSELALLEDLDHSGTWVERAFTHIYRGYVRRQEALFPRTVALVRRLRLDPDAPDLRAAYREHHRPLLPVCAWLGQNVRFAQLAVTCMVGWPLGFPLVSLLPLNLILAFLIYSHEHASGRLLSGDAAGLSVAAVVEEGM